MSSESEERRDSRGRFHTKRLVKTDYAYNENDDTTVAEISERWVDDDVEFHPVRVDVLEEVIERAADGHSHVMLATPTQHTKDGAKTCLVLAASEDDWWVPAGPGESPNRTIVLGAGTTYTYAGDDEDTDWENAIVEQCRDCGAYLVDVKGRQFVHEGDGGRVGV